MASKKGKQPRRKLPKPLLENFEDFPLPKIECSKCNRNFEVTLLGGKFLNRTCPYCGKKIVPAEYDSKASEYLKTIQSIQEALVVYKEEATRLQASLLNCAKWWHMPKKTILRFRLKLFQKYKSPKVRKLNVKLKEQKEHLQELARQRYYVTEWYLCTHIPLLSEGGSLEAKYSIENAKHSVRLVKNWEKNGGILGEMKVFKKFLQECLKENSALFGCRLLPNLYIPIPSDELKRKRSFWSQVDLIVLTCQCAFVVEIKNWNAHIYVDAETGEIYSSNKNLARHCQSYINDGIVYYKTDQTLEQNSDHASWFYEVCKSYPFERIYEVTLFVNIKSFRSSFFDFENNIFVGELYGLNPSPLDLMGATCSTLSPVMDSEAMNALAESLLGKYGDLNQKRGRKHISALAS